MITKHQLNLSFRKYIFQKSLQKSDSPLNSISPVIQLIYLALKIKFFQDEIAESTPSANSARSETALLKSIEKCQAKSWMKYEC